MPFLRLRTYAVFLLLLLLPVLIADAQPAGLPDIREWLGRDELAAPYRIISDKIIRVFEDAGGRDIPLEPLFDKLKEGAAKRIPAEDLAAYLAEEGHRLFRAREAVNASGLVPPGVRIDTGLLKSSAMALLSGISDENLYAVLFAARDSGRGLSAALEFLPALVRMEAVASLPPDEISPLASALFSGRVPVRSYGSLVSLYLRASAGRIPSDVIIRLMTDILAVGGGIIQIERELARRLRNP